MTRAFDELDSWGMATTRYQLCYRWMGVRTGTMAGVFSGIVGVFVILWPGVTAALAGFALSFAVITGNTFFTILSDTVAVELAMTSAERILEYTDMPTEDPLGGKPAPAMWPTKGELQVENLTVGYADDLPLVLKDVSFSIKWGERVGVVGRTGAGKSTLTLSLFRFIEAKAGAIFIDGFDIAKIRLKDLRSRVAIIPQVRIHIC